MTSRVRKRSILLICTTKTQICSPNSQTPKFPSTHALNSFTNKISQEKKRGRKYRIISDDLRHPIWDFKSLPWSCPNYLHCIYIELGLLPLIGQVIHTTTSHISYKILANNTKCQVLTLLLLSPKISDPLSLSTFLSPCCLVRIFFYSSATLLTIRIKIKKVCSSRGGLRFPIPSIF